MSTHPPMIKIIPDLAKDPLSGYTDPDSAFRGTIRLIGNHPAPRRRRSQVNVSVLVVLDNGHHVIATTELFLLANAVEALKISSIGAQN